MFRLSSGIGFAEFVKWRINEWRKQGKQVLKIMVAGKVGAGKSALVNGLIGREVAVEGDSAASVTTTVNQYKKVINGVTVVIFDTPGLFDPRAGCDRETLQEICQKTKGTIDLLLICMKMTERLEQSHVLLIERLKLVFKTDAVWKNTLLVLTFANEVRLPRKRHQSYESDDEEPKQQQLIDHFEEKLGEFNMLLPKYLHGHIPAHLLKKIPVVPAGYDDPNLPGHDDWLSKFWLKVFTRSSESVKIALLRITEDRFIENPSREIMPPHLQRISMKVTYGAIVGAALGKAVGKIKGMVISSKDIEDVQRECEREGASLGARFVLYFYKLQTPLDYTVDYILDKIDLEGFIQP